VIDNSATYVLDFLPEANNRRVLVFASRSGNDVSQEDKRWGHSAFAKALIEGLQGKAAYRKARLKSVTCKIT
jgi:hypothetical protein